MITYISIIVLLLYLADYFFSKQIYQFIFVVFSLTSPLSLFIPVWHANEFLTPLVTDRYTMLAIFFILGLGQLYQLVTNNESVGIEYKKIVMISLLLLLNSFELKIILVLFFASLLWFKEAKNITGVIVSKKIFFTLFFLFFLRFKFMPFDFEICSALLLVLLIIQLVNNNTALEVFSLLLMSSLVEHRFGAVEVQRWSMFLATVILMLPYLYKDSIYKKVMQLLNKNFVIKRLLTRSRLLKSFNIIVGPGMELITPNLTIETDVAVVDKGYLEHSSDLLIGVLIVLLLIILGVVWV